VLKDPHLHDALKGLSSVSASVLMLDFDGTIAPFVTERDKAAVRPDCKKLIDQIMNSGKTKVVIVTGRTIEDILPLINLETVPEIWGSHGWERREMDGSYYLWPAQDSHTSSLHLIMDLIADRGMEKFREDKPRSTALHWRGLPKSEESRLKLLAAVEIKLNCDKYGLEFREFDGGAEARIPGRNKGDVVTSLIQEEGDGCFYAYLGDDSTDEDAFDAIAGHGMGILVGENIKPTKAEYNLDSNDGLEGFLNTWNELLQGGG